MGVEQLGHWRIINIILVHSPDYFAVLDHDVEIGVVRQDADYGQPLDGCWLQKYAPWSPIPTGMELGVWRQTKILYHGGDAFFVKVAKDTSAEFVDLAGQSMNPDCS